MDNWHDVSDEKEQKQAQRSYDAAKEHVPAEGLPDELGEIEAAITIGFDADDRFHVVANAPEDKQVLVANAADIVRELLAHYSQYCEEREEFTRRYEKWE